MSRHRSDPRVNRQFRCGLGEVPAAIRGEAPRASSRHLGPENRCAREVRRDQPRRDPQALRSRAPRRGRRPDRAGECEPLTRRKDPNMQSSPKRNAFYAQSGGVTAVINATAAGVIETARAHKKHIGKVYAGRNGILGALMEDLIDTSKDSAAAIA